ncbi:MAG: hypothetical protein L0L56_03520, partial [Lacticaseibacillus paracasei]|nr:hypothetical protein [Lacticaseibacillus paracasei]
AQTGAFRNRSISGLKPKWLGFGHLGLRSLRAGFWTGERVLAKSCEQAIRKRQRLMAEKTLVITFKA